MTEILTQLCGMVESAIVDEREIYVGIRNGKDTMMFSFFPTDYNIEEGLEIKGDAVSFNILNKYTVVTYDPVEDEYIITSEAVTYYLGII